MAQIGPTLSSEKKFWYQKKSPDEENIVTSQTISYFVQAEPPLISTRKIRKSFVCLDLGVFFPKRRESLERISMASKNLPIKAHVLTQIIFTLNRGDNRSKIKSNI